MFVKKSVAEINAMTETEQNAYMEAKAAHEAEQNKNLVKTEVEEAVKGSKEEVEALKSTVADLKETIKAQGEKIVDMSKGKGTVAKQDIMDAFKEQYESAEKDGDFSLKDKQKISIDVEKVTISSDVMSATTVNSTQFPTAGATRAVDDTVAVVNAQNIGFASYRKPYSRIMELVDVMPLEGQNLLIINETVTGDAAVTPECTLKPIVKVVYSAQQAPAAPVAAEWATTTQLRRFYPMIANRMRNKIAELVMDKTPASVLAAVVAGGTAFTSDANLAINTDPNNYDALGAAIAQLETRGFQPNAIVVHPIAYRNMLQDKASDGHYTLYNGNAISIVNEAGLMWGDRLIRWVLDPTIGVDRFIVGDLRQSVKVGLDNELLYFETDGRTDATTAGASGLSRNIRTHVLERFVSTIIPTPTQIGIITDTFANVKTLITAEEES